MKPFIETLTTDGEPNIINQIIDNQKVENMKNQREVYIENYKSGKTYDPIENRWYGASWEVETMTRQEAKDLIADNPNEFENCQIVEK